MHCDVYFKRENARTLYCNSQKDRKVLTKYKKGYQAVSMGVSLDDIVHGIFSTAHEVSATVQQFLPALLVPTPPDMFLKNKTEYYKSLHQKYNGIWLLRVVRSCFLCRL